MRILVAEDDRTTRLFVSEALMTAGYRVTAVENGQEALEKFRRAPFPIVISDWQMPMMDGMELCRNIRNLHSKNYTYFIILTSLTDRDKIHRALANGADDYLVKPYHETELVLRARIGQRTVNLETRNMMHLVMQRLIEKRSNETGAHLIRIREMAVALVEAAAQCHDFRKQINGEFVQRIGETAWLHDIGKAAVPDHILLKPGALDAEEHRTMEAHAVHGAEVFDTALKEYPDSSYLRMACEIAGSHHEKFDGTGYPNGLKGDEIPLAGRIVAICDVYDALTTSRVYKDTVAHAEAVEVILKSSGSHFDPRLVNSFLAVLEKFRAISERYPDEVTDSSCPSTRGSGKVSMV